VGGWDGRDEPELVRRVLALTPAAILVVDGAGTITFVNESVEPPSTASRRRWCLLPGA
jgi:hypothetical protein